MSACPGISRVKENFIVKGNLLEFTSWEQKTGIIKTCSDEGCYQDKIRTRSFRGHTLKGFSVYFFFQALWTLGKFVWNCSQVMGRCMWEGLSLQYKPSNQHHSPVVRGEGTFRGDWWPQVRAGYPGLTSVTLVLFLWFVERAGCLTYFQFLLGVYFWRPVENLWGYHNNQKAKYNVLKFLKGGDGIAVQSLWLLLQCFSGS